MRKTFVSGLILASMITTLYASLKLLPYDKSKPPKMILPVAYGYAIAALGVDTNQFHCVSATITRTFTSEGEWYFTFYSTDSNALPKQIAVGFDGKVIFDNGWR